MNTKKLTKLQMEHVDEALKILLSHLTNIPPRSTIDETLGAMKEYAAMEMLKYAETVSDVTETILAKEFLEWVTDNGFYDKNRAPGLEASFNWKRTGIAESLSTEELLDKFLDESRNL